MKEYELVVLLHPDLEIDLDKPKKKIDSVIADAKGKINKADVWGKRKLSYKIAHEDFAVYIYYEIELDPLAVDQVEKALNITDEVMRYLLTYPVPKIESNRRISESDEEQVEAEIEPKPRTRTKKAAVAAKEA